MLAKGCGREMKDSERVVAYDSEEYGDLLSEESCYGYDGVVDLLSCR